MVKMLRYLFDKEKHEKQKTDIENNRERIREQNYIIFKNSALLFFILMTILAGFTFLFSELNSGRIVYSISAVSGGLLYLFAVLFLKKHTLSSLPFHYILYTISLWMSCEDAIFLNNGEGSAVAFCGMILIFSILTIDYFYRINGYIIILTIIFILCAYYFEPRLYAVRDIANAFVFCILSLIIGSVSRLSKLSDFENQRICRIERNIDTLTGIPNRRSLFESLAACEKPACQDPYTGAIMIDIDNFKTYNDTYGHQAGDKVLKQIGCFLRDYGVDFKFDVFRYGGEEFLVMTREQNGIMLDTLAANLVKTIRALKIPYKVSLPKIVTISAGYSFLHEISDKHYEKLIKQADTALYTAKKSGRNQAAGYIEGESVNDYKDHAELFRFPFP
jgi:diguanylate cyclase (GGDEF)-like protein